MAEKHDRMLIYFRQNCQFCNTKVMFILSVVEPAVF